MIYKMVNCSITGIRRQVLTEKFRQLKAIIKDDLTAIYSNYTIKIHYPLILTKVIMLAFKMITKRDWSLVVGPSGFTNRKLPETDIRILSDPCWPCLLLDIRINLSS